MNVRALYKIFQQHPLICTDSRKSTKGSVFFALKGENFNGNKFAEKAISEGCDFAVVDEKKYATNNRIILVDNVLHTLQELARYHRQQLSIPVVGITGTNGKTTSKELINTVLSSTLNCYATKGNLNNHIGVPLSLLAINKHHEIAIIEMGANHPEEIDFLCNIAQPTHGAITNIGAAHLEGFGNLQGVIDTKNELYQFIIQRNGHLFVNVCDELLMSLSKNGIRTTYGKKADVEGDISNNTPFIQVHYKNTNIKSNLIGDYQFNNIMLAICVGAYFNISTENIKKSIEHYIPTNNRSQIIQTKKNTLILDAYNANPSSMQAMIHSFAAQNYQHKICILGDMLELGDYSKKEHQNIISLCNTLGLSCYFIGSEFKNSKNESFKNRHVFEEFLKNNPISDKTILLKGSRGIGLENLVDLL